MGARTWAALGACALPLLVAAAPALGQDEGMEPIGDVRFATSCAPEARDPFDHAVALLHHMTYSQAGAEFAAIAEADPGCAMAHWGVAVTLFQPLWPTRPSEDDLRRGRDAVARARSLGPGTERERMFVEAAGAFFDAPDAHYWDRIAGWAERPRALYDAYPDDIEAAAFFALSHLAVAPGTGGLENNEEAAAVLAGILGRSPEHPGGIHYTIHANDADGRQGESLDVVARYSRIAPRNPHALHMPTHIYTRLGDWEKVIEGNREAALAALEHPAGDRGQWVWDEFPHAIEYMVYAMLQAGDDDGALEQTRRLQGTADLQPSTKTAFHLASIPSRYALERRDWEVAAALEPRPGVGLDWDLYPWPEAVTWFARAVGSAMLGEIQAAREAVARLEALREISAERGEEMFARQIRILRLGARAWLARAEGDADGAVALLREAAALEAATPKPPVTPAPTLPAIEQLGDLLLELDRPAEALEAYEESLRRTPGRFNSVRGAARAAERAGGDAATRDGGTTG